jgi:arylsulfatase A-like enzyme
MNENGVQHQYGHADGDYLTDVIAGKAAAFIERSAAEGRPFFVELATYAPHSPATPAPRHAGLFAGVKAPRTPSFNEPDVSDKPLWVQSMPVLSVTEIASIDDLHRKRLRSLQAVDDMVATIVQKLEELGQLGNTYIFFTSDNGFHLGQHRLPQGKLTPYEEDILVPLLVRGPGVPAGRVLDHITGNVDLAPTFAELAGALIPDWVRHRRWRAHGGRGSCSRSWTSRPRPR